MRSSGKRAVSEAPVLFITASIVLALSISITAVIAADPATTRAVAVLLFAIILPPVLDVAEKFLASLC